MRDFSEQLKNQSFLFTNCDVAKGNFLPHILEEEASTVFNTCDNPARKNIITCKDIHLSKFLAEVGGLSFDLKLSSTFEDLPFYIPVFGRELTGLSDLSNEFPVIATSLVNILDGITLKAGAFHEKSKITFRRSISRQSFGNKKVILFNTGPDTLIESVWHKRDKFKLFDEISKLGFYAIGGLNFSLINGECSLSHVLNQKRSLYSCYLFEQRGSLVIPHTYSLTISHVKRWVNWLRANPNINYVTINCQLQTSHSDMTQLIQTTKYLLYYTPHVHIILQGFQFSYIKHFGHLVDRLHFADMSPFKKAQSHQRLKFNLKDNKLEIIHDAKESLTNLININFSERYLYLKQLRNLSKTDPEFDLTQKPIKVYNFKTKRGVLYKREA